MITDTKIMSDTIVKGKDAFYCALHETEKELYPFVAVISIVTNRKEKFDTTEVQAVERTAEISVPKRMKEQSDDDYQKEVAKFHVLVKQGNESSYKGETESTTVLITENMDVIKDDIRTVQVTTEKYKIPFYSLPGQNFFSECCLHVIRNARKKDKSVLM